MKYKYSPVLKFGGTVKSFFVHPVDPLQFVLAECDTTDKAQAVVDAMNGPLTDQEWGLLENIVKHERDMPIRSMMAAEYEALKKLCESRHKEKP